MSWVTDNLTPAQRTAYEAQLVAGYKTRTLVQLLDIDEKNPVTLTQQVLDGEVQVSTEADISRSCTLELEDSSGKLNWGHRDGSDYSIYPGRMIRVHHSVWVDSLAMWIDVPVFTGPITGFTKDKGTVSLEAQGKEWLLHAPFVQWHTMSWKKGANVLQVMRRVLADKGERKLAFPKRTGARLKRDITIPRTEDTWPFLKFLARLAGNRRLYYRGDGMLVLRPHQQSGWAWVFGDADILDVPAFSFDLSVMYNTVNIEYEKGTRTFRHTQFIARGSQMSPETLNRNGQPLVMASFYSSQAVDSEDAAIELGRKLVQEGVEIPVILSFPCLPIPFLEEGQRVAADVDGHRYTFSMREFSFGLAPGGNMTVNISSDQLQRRKKKKGGKKK